MNLIDKKCVPCEGGTPPLNDEQETELIKQIDNWQLLDDGTHKLRRHFKFKNFKEAMEFVNKVANIAETQQHHPDIYVFYNKVQLDLFTHAVGGLSENDFIMAAKINSLLGAV
jgi:4a-hydroxytetrahydrobiopterin dehydratase